MEKELKRYVGQRVEIVYLDRNSKITQRQISIYSISGGTVKAYCHTKQALRTFKTADILAIAKEVNHGHNNQAADRQTGQVAAAH